MSLPLLGRCSRKTFPSNSQSASESAGKIIYGRNASNVKVCGEASRFIAEAHLDSASSLDGSSWEHLGNDGIGHDRTARDEILLSHEPLERNIEVSPAIGSFNGHRQPSIRSSKKDAAVRLSGPALLRPRSPRSDVPATSFLYMREWHRRHSDMEYRHRLRWA